MTIKVLICDDQDIVRKGLNIILSHSEGITVVGQASNGREAIDLAKKTEPDVICMDLKMPQINGVQATQQITKLLPKSRILVLTTFDADEWVAIAQAAGMNYMVITSKHHDGFALFDSEVSDYNIVDATPFGRDVIKELEEATKKAGMSFGVYYSHSVDWHDGGDGGYKDYVTDPPTRWLMANTWDPHPRSYEEYLDVKALPQTQELLDNYDLSQIWFDFPAYIPEERSIQFYKTVYDANPEILVNSRVGNDFGDIGVPGDNIIPSESSDNTWEGIATTNHSWGYKSYDNDWKSPIETPSAKSYSSIWYQ